MDFSVEEWRDVPGWEGLYQVSCWGRVHSLDRYVTKRSDNSRFFVAGRVLRQSSDQQGYAHVGLNSGERKWTAKVHILVALAFVGPKPFATAHCRHLDGKKENNYADNILWGTAKENGEDRVRHGTAAKGERSGVCKLSDAQIERVRILGRGGVAVRSISREMQVSQSLVSHILTQRIRPNGDAHIRKLQRRALLSATEVLSIRARRIGGESVKSLQASFGLSETGVRNILSGIAWKEVGTDHARH